MATAGDIRQKFNASIVERDNGCIEWVKAQNVHGYGVIRCEGGITKLAHRYIWGEVYGDPGRSHILHHCDNPCCANITHLFIGDAALNMADKMKKGRHRWGVGNALKGELNPWAKLTPSDVISIRNEHGTHRQIGEKFGISHRYVSDIKNRRRWAHLDDVA